MFLYLFSRSKFKTLRIQMIVHTEGLPTLILSNMPVQCCPN
jgi:hypothetical protein